MVTYKNSNKYVMPRNVGDLLFYIKNIKPSAIPIKTVFYKGKKLCNLNNGSYKKNINKLTALNNNTPVRVKYKRARRCVGDYEYFNTRMQFLVVFID